MSILTRHSAPVDISFANPVAKRVTWLYITVVTSVFSGVSCGPAPSAIIGGIVEAKSLMREIDAELTRRGAPVASSGEPLNAVYPNFPVDTADPFSATGEAFWYVSDGDCTLIVSRGPDGDFERSYGLAHIAACSVESETRPEHLYRTLQVLQYDKSNGLMSSGDILRWDWLRRRSAQGAPRGEE